MDPQYPTSQFAGFGAGPPPMPGYGMGGPPPMPPHPLAGAFSPAALQMLQGAGVLPPHGAQPPPAGPQMPQQPDPAQQKQMKALQDALAAFGRV